MAETVEQLEGWEDPDHSAHTDDSWHAHAGEMPPQYAHGTISPLVIFGIGLGGFIAVIICIVMITVYFRMESQQEIATKQEIALDAGYRAKQSSWTARLSGYEWVDPQQGVVQIPLNVAKDKVAEAYAQQ